jgi:hypothetical protein
MRGKDEVVKKLTNFLLKGEEMCPQSSGGLLEEWSTWHN